MGKSPDKIIPTYLLIGALYNAQGRVEEAEEMFKGVIKHYEKLGKESEPIYEVKQDSRYDELQYVDDILNINFFEFSLEQNKTHYILEGKKLRSNALWSKVKAEINKEDYSIAKLEFYNEINGADMLTKAIIYENISFNNNFSDEDFMIVEV